MHDVPERLEQLLRSQGVTDEQLDELRRTGSIASLETNSISIDGVTVSGDSATPSPEALAQLRRFHGFLPAGTVEQIELATGEDIDGDDVIGSVSDAPGMPAHDSVQHMTTQHAQDAASASGPFVRSNPARSFLVPMVLVVVAAGAVIAYLATR